MHIKACSEVVTEMLLMFGTEVVAYMLIKAGTEVELTIKASRSCNRNAY